MSQLFWKGISLLELPTVFTIPVRYRTKPRWVPVAKTKQFRIPVRHSYPEEDEVEQIRLWNMYRTQLRATISEIKRSYQASATADEVILKRQQDIEDSWKESMRINDEWNAQLAIEREERDKLVKQKRLEQADKEMKAEDAKRAAKQAYYDQLIREQQEQSKNFITKENIEAHIEKILNEEPYSYLWAIDLKGNVYEGYNKTPTPNKRLSVHRFIADNAIPETIPETIETEVKAES